MEWIKFSEYNLPPQGLKILCFKQGDLWVARRFAYKGKSIYVEIQYGGGTSMLTDTPDFWMQLELPQGYTGYMKVGVEDSEQMTFDEMEIQYPKQHLEFVKMIVACAKKS